MLVEMPEADIRVDLLMMRPLLAILTRWAMSTVIRSHGHGPTREPLNPLPGALTMRGLNGTVAVITGAAGGIGRALVRRFCEEGSHVIGLDVNAGGLDELAGRLGDFADH